MALIIGIDPSSGATSEVGVSAFDSDTNAIIFAHSFQVPAAQKKNLHHRVRYISQRLEDMFQSWGVHEDEKAYVYIESTVMRGASGESLARATGAILSAVPYNFEQEWMHNTAVKKLVGGHGRAEKDEVASGVLSYFEGDDAVQILIEAKKWDALDSLAIAIAGFMRESREG